MAIHIGIVETFPNAEADKAQAMKVLEEAAEAMAAWQIWNDAPEEYEFEALMDECADVIQATSNLLAALCVDDFTPYMEKCRKRNQARGRM